MVDTGIAIFTYNRSEHLKKVLAGLKNNEIRHKVYIFQDGMKNHQRDLKQWHDVKKVIDEIDWLEFEYVSSEWNKGCAKSIEDGIGYVLDRHEAVIILEDDCVPLPNFLSYMDSCLEKYQQNQHVIGIGGFAWNLDMDIHNADEDVYASGRTMSAAWGTWKNRWECYARDYEILRRIYANQDASERLGIWGGDLESILCNTLVCRLDAWDIFWALHAIEKNKVFIIPYKSFIDNIGFDGSGMHSGNTDRFKPRYFADEIRDFRLIDNCEPTVETKMALASLWNGYGHYPEYKNQDCKKAIIWGTGKCYRKNKKDILKRYDVQAFIDRRKIQFFEGKQVIDCEMIQDYEYDDIVIAFHNTAEAERMKEKLMGQYGISEDKIVIL
ncbi:MAG: glycosyltransferase [Roseburia sp.]|nr:glycosyltransferase [Roseburia sp.]MCM1201644.1 glycosyltransferase [Bacteroides fragilis]